MELGGLNGRAFWKRQQRQQYQGKHKGLSLDPHKNHHHHQLHQNQNQNQVQSSRNVEEQGEEEEEEEEEKDPSEKEDQFQQHFHGFHHHPHLQQAQQLHQYHHQQQQLLYGRLELETQPALPPAQQPPKKRSYFPSSSSQDNEYARLGDKMGDTQQQHQHRTTASRLGLRNSGGEIVEVQGGHIVRSTGRKDRHSKVCTAKGPRDRRVRLSAHTAIQFYDVQDRLGYDRPSKAVDWLIKKAKSAIDELAELPAWKPTANSTANTSFEQDPHQIMENIGGSSVRRGGTMLAAENEDDDASRCMVANDRTPELHIRNDQENSSSFLPPSMDSDSIADTIKSFFPMGASTANNSSSMQFQTFPTPNLLSRTSSQSQDLRLSLQSFQDPIMLHHHHHQAQHQNPTHQSEQQTLYSGNTQMGFDGSGWSENQAAEISRFQRMVSWNSGGDAGSSAASAGGGGAFMFNNQPSTTPLLQPLFGQPQFFSSQRGPLQSSNTPSVRAWMDPIADNHHHQQQLQQALPFHQSLSGIGFASGGVFTGFRVPARIQGEEEEHDGISDKPSSASSDSRH
ncbi:hypothetical protein RJ640_004388 [Escallonia rubra]|uniref:TCP domain-containing protein n=1 Tax=Escallonia rubra TaxID=112253 RepID=A0AA88RD36_9ASTE|nr:hypothetical protein RJ640_004388 [Escallonia rubra]